MEPSNMRILNRLSLPAALTAAALVAACDEQKFRASNEAHYQADEPGEGAKKTEGKEGKAEAKDAKKEEGIKIDRSLLAQFDKLPAAFASTKNAPSEAKVSLGKQLYFETRLSKNQDVSCNSCHDLAKYGVDGNPRSFGHKKQLGGRNSPTVYNAAGHFVQFWDGRAADVEAQAKGPILNPAEMAMKDDKAVVAVLNSIPEYQEAFKKAFPDAKDPVSYDNLALAIGAFERTLTTPAPFDKYLAGDEAALNDEEKKGFALFLATGCTTCHTGVTVGGSMYQKLGLAKPWDRPITDSGRKAITKQDVDNLMFKVPSLRNVAKTGPYFHDGSIATLDEAVTLMAKYQLGKELKADEVKSIVTFLGALTGELPKITPPALPPSSPKTPKPDPT
jgi:cytochrome c peroxidase